ncbi:hypothetical protein AB0I54_42465 [Streptomyces sp. NPDC050625]|uniref:hypothetical protein n=1 Tax=Streptomyces sp. NPDC050625 TaxID=3154629 RepID=UPI00343A703E
MGIFQDAQDPDPPPVDEVGSDVALLAVEVHSRHERPACQHTQDRDDCSHARIEAAAQEAGRDPFIRNAYASPEQLAAWSGAPAPADAERLIARASEDGLD